MAINMMCMNDECKYYWEDSCMKNINETRIVINNRGNCETFEIGKSEWYEDIEKCKEEATVIVKCKDCICEIRKENICCKDCELVNGCNFKCPFRNMKSEQNSDGECLHHLNI